MYNLERMLTGKINSMKQVSDGVFEVTVSIDANPKRVNELKLGTECVIEYNIDGKGVFEECPSG
jgi:hypothetical protein